MCAVETRKSGYKHVLNHDPDPSLELTEVPGQIAAIIYDFEGAPPSYRIIIPDDMAGWIISTWHVLHQKVAAAFVGKKFSDVSEDFIIRKVKS